MLAPGQGVTLAHSPAHMGTKRQQPLKGPLTEGSTASKKSKQLVAAGKCRECGSALGRAVTVCDTCANRARLAEAARREADKAAAQKEADKNSPLLAPSELQAPPEGGAQERLLRADLTQTAHGPGRRGRQLSTQLRSAEVGLSPSPARQRCHPWRGGAAVVRLLHHHGLVRDEKA